MFSWNYSFIFFVSMTLAYNMYSRKYTRALFCTALPSLIECNARLLTCTVKSMKRAESLASKFHLHRCRIYLLVHFFGRETVHICILWQLSHATQGWINTWSKIDDTYSRIEIPETFDTDFWLTAPAIYLGRINLVKYFSINHRQVNTKFLLHNLNINLHS